MKTTQKSIPQLLLHVYVANFNLFNNFKVKWPFLVPFETNCLLWAMWDGIFSSQLAKALAPALLFEREHLISILQHAYIWDFRWPAFLPYFSTERLCRHSRKEKEVAVCQRSLQGCQPDRRGCKECRMTNNNLSVPRYCHVVLESCHRRAHWVGSRDMTFVMLILKGLDKILFKWDIVHVGTEGYSVSMNSKSFCDLCLPQWFQQMYIFVKTMITNSFLCLCLMFCIEYLSVVVPCRSTPCTNPWGICIVTSRECQMTWIEKSSGGIGIWVDAQSLNIITVAQLNRTFNLQRMFSYAPQYNKSH